MRPAGFAAILKAERPDIVHCIALQGRSSSAARRPPWRGSGGGSIALTGLGLIGARSDRIGKLARSAPCAASCAALATPRTRYLFENADDPELLGLDPADAKVTIVGGAGVDPEALRPAPLPPQPPLRVAVVARMLWSKGVDIAVEAVRSARGRGRCRSSCRSTARPIRRTRRPSRERRCGP